MKKLLMIVVILMIVFTSCAFESTRILYLESQGIEVLNIISEYSFMVTDGERIGYAYSSATFKKALETKTILIWINGWERKGE